MDETKLNKLCDSLKDKQLHEVIIDMNKYGYSVNDINNNVR